LTVVEADVLKDFKKVEEQEESVVVEDLSHNEETENE
jgi:hypothetical protein